MRVGWFSDIGGVTGVVLCVEGFVMRGLAGWLFDHKFVVFAGWAVVLVGLLGVARVAGDSYQFDINISSSESVRAMDTLTKHSPMVKGDTLTVTWSAPDVRVAGVQDRVESVLDAVRANPNVVFVLDPYVPADGVASQVSADGRFGYATVQMDLDSINLPPASVNSIVDVVRAGSGSGVVLAVGGQAITQANPPGGSASEGLGMAAAALILLMAFGSVVAAGLPLVSAGVALGAAAAVVTLLTHVMKIPSFAPQMVSLIGIGVGIDYALFVVSRHRAGLMRGKGVRESVLDAFDTSGRAVLFAGVTVMISILGLLIVNIGFLSGLAIATSVGVLFTMLVTLTLLPALLSLIGFRVLGRRARRELAVDGPHGEERSTRWGAWAAVIQARPWRFIVGAVVLLAVLSVPALDLRLGNADQGSDPVGSVTRSAYDMVSAGFGAGSNGPLLLVSEVGHAGDLALLKPVIEGVPGVVSVGDPVETFDKKVSFMSVTPVDGPQEKSTSDLIRVLREDVLPANAAHPVAVTGVTAVFDDFSASLQSKLPWFLLGVLSLSSVLLLVAFRSVAIPVKAALMNLLAAGAAFGVVTAVFQWGWGASLIGLPRTGPVDAFYPIMLLAVLFGLSMDYQVFLVSRMKEEWSRSGDNSTAVRLGLADTGRVITAAALIMIFVFTAFVFGSDRIIKMFGVGLAVSIFLDAFVIRSLLVPAIMQVMGRWNWWIPRWLDRVLPRFTVEPSLVEGGEGRPAGGDLVVAEAGAGRARKFRRTVDPLPPAGTGEFTVFRPDGNRN